MNHLRKRSLSLLSCLIIATSLNVAANNTPLSETTPLSQPALHSTDIQTILNKPLYKNAQWGLQVIDTKNNQTIIDMSSSTPLFIGSVRKIFTVGELLNQMGPTYQSTTTVHTDGEIIKHELKGNLVLIASGDLTMGGRTKKNGAIAITDFDHNEADTLGNAQLTKPDPLAGYKALAKQIRKAGIKKISGDVIIDTRLFDTFNFRDEFNVSPIFVNDDIIDVIINPGKLNKKAQVEWRPQSAAFNLTNNLITSPANTHYTLTLKPVIPLCIGQPGCQSEINNQLPIDFTPPFTKTYPLIQTVRISKPANFARTVFIEALRDAGIDISSLTLVKENPSELLKDKTAYTQDNQIAVLQSLPYSEHAKLILKVSYNIGADTSLVLFGLTQGVRNMPDSLRIEKMMLDKQHGIPTTSFNFVDGSGGGDTKATNTAVTKWLQIMTKSESFKPFFDALPILAVDGSLGFVKQFREDPTLKGATGHVHAKTGTYITSENKQLLAKGQALAGYINTKNNNMLIFHVVVNNVPINSLNEVMEMFQDQGTIAAILWRDF